MQQNGKFVLSGQSEILTPETAGIGSLIRGLREGRSIVVTQQRSEPVSVLESGDQYLYCESSGTGGRPKIIRRQPLTWIRSFEVNRELFDIDSSDTYAVLGHLGHSLTLYAALEALHVGADLMSLAGVSPGRQIEQIDSRKTSVIYATPTQLRLLVAGMNSLRPRKLMNVRRLFVGGGELDAGLVGILNDLFPIARIREFYGTSETSFITMSNDNTPDGSVGMPYPQVTVEIGHTGSCSFQAGEIWVHSPYLFDGYVVDDVVDAGETRGGYVRTGEIGYQDEQGNLFLTGRMDRMVTVSDVNVHPEQIERILLQESGVNQCVAMPFHDERRGARIAVVIGGAENAGLEIRIRKRCRKELHEQAVPNRFLYLPSLPTLPAGKPDHRRIQKMLDQIPWLE